MNDESISLLNNAGVVEERGRDAGWRTEKVGLISWSMVNGRAE
jgi:hypothetical protein